MTINRGTWSAALLILALAATQVACDDQGESGGTSDTGSSGDVVSDSTSSDTVEDGESSDDSGVSDTGDDSTGCTGDTCQQPDATDPPPETCDAPISLADVSSPDHVVGNGTPQSCTEEAFRSAATDGGIIVFDCGDSDATISITDTVDVPNDRDTIIDGGGTVTLDGGDGVRILRFHHPNYRTNENRLVLQRITLQNAHAQGTDYTPQDSDNPACAYGYADGAGGAVRVRNGVLHVVASNFISNQAASPGPDVGGGAIYALGSLDVTVVDSTFVDNSGANGGAVGLLQTDGTFVNTRFEGNRSTGTGQNFAGGDAEGCPGVGHENQGGAGGNGGAISIDGADDMEQYFCGVTFLNNEANELGGCVFRTANGAQRKATVLQSNMVGNHAGAGGGCLYISNSDFTLSRSLVSGNSADGLGGGVRTELGSVVDITNTTFHGNSVQDSLAAALVVGNAGQIRNCTFANNRVEGDETVFTAAIRGGSGVNVSNTLFVDNTTPAPYNPQACNHDPFAGQNNVQWPRMTHDDTREDWPCTADITWDNPDLGPLDDNGGPTRTMAPATGSVAIGLGQSCPDVDQRGEPRPEDGCTAGAVEWTGN